MDNKTPYSQLWNVSHLAFKGLQASTLVAAVGGFGYYGLKARTIDKAVLEATSTVTGRAFTFAFPALTAAMIAMLFTQPERPVPRAERLAKNWRQQTVDALSFVGAIAFPLIRRSPNLVGDIGLGAAAGTAIYCLLMPLLPHYDSKDWTATDPRTLAAAKK